MAASCPFPSPAGKFDILGLWICGGSDTAGFAGMVYIGLGVLHLDRSTSIRV